MKHRFLPYFVLLTLSLLSCHRIPLYDPDSSIYLKLELKLDMDVKVPDYVDLAAYPDLAAKVHCAKPTSVRACFYDVETHRLAAEDFVGGDGGFIDLAAGTYDMIVYNLGNENTRVTATETRGGAYAYTSGLNTRVKVTKAGTSQVREYDVIYEPDHLLVGRMEQVVIPVHETGENKRVVIEDNMSTLLETYSFEMPNIQGAERIKTVDIYITGQAPSRYLWDKRYPTRPVAIWFPAKIEPSAGRLYSVFNTFGKFPDSQSDVFLYVRMTNGQGGLFQWTFDVTDQFNNPDNTDHTIIIDDHVEIPEEGSDGGFTPTVNDWNAEIIDIQL